MVRLRSLRWNPHSGAQRVGQGAGKSLDSARRDETRPKVAKQSVDPSNSPTRRGVAVSGSRCTNLLVVSMGICVLGAGQALGADVYKGTAKYTNAQGERVSTVVTISLDGATTDAERAPLVEKAKASPEAAKSVL